MSTRLSAESLNTRHPLRWILGIVVVGVVALGAWYVFTTLSGSTPDFPSLADEPDPSLHGTVAYITSTNAGMPDAQWCLHLASASGEFRREVACRDDLMSDAPLGPVVAWREDGRIELTHYAEVFDMGQGEQTFPKWRLLVDPLTGVAEEVALEQVPDDRPADPTEAVLDDVTVRAVNKDGLARLEITDSTGTRTLWESEGTTNLWEVKTPAWSPDGQWLLVPDAADRILLVTVAEPVQAYVFLGEPAPFAITAEDLLP